MGMSAYVRSPNVLSLNAIEKKGPGGKCVGRKKRKEETNKMLGTVRWPVFWAR